MSAFGRLYRGESHVDFVGHRKRWYLVSAILLAICVGSFVLRGFNFGIEFAGGNQFSVPVKAGTSVEAVRSAVEGVGVEVAQATVVGQGADRQYVIRTPGLDQDRRSQAVAAVTRAAGVTPKEVNSTEVSSAWGRSVTTKALEALAIFLVLVSIYIWVRYEQKMAIAAIGALAHDLLLTAGAYSLIGFEVTPGTVVGLLTILGFSLYDTVVVFDKVDENSKGVLGSSRQTYPEVANTALNQTLMRSINTTLIALLPVAGLLFVGAGLLGVGTLKDLALVLFVGMLTGAYSSLFLATPWLVDLKLTDKRYKLHTQRILAKRAAAASDQGRAERTPVPAGAAPAAEDDPPARGDALAASTAPRVGARPGGQQRKRPSGKRR
jgi:preprotein translocase subunit SecF